MNILLINPRSWSKATNIVSYFPTGFAYVASYLRKQGFAVNVIDLQAARGKLDDDKILTSAIRTLRPGVVGIGCLFSFHYPCVKEVAKKIKRMDPGLPVVLGGPHATMFHKEILAGNQDIDFVVLGEGEETFLSLCRKLKNRDTNFESLDGFSYKKKGHVRSQPKTRFIERLDDLPFPCFDLFDMRPYFYHARYSRRCRGMSVLTSRSCPNRCTFCSVSLIQGPRWRPRGVEDVLGEIEYLYHTYRVRYFQFLDEHLTVDRTRTLRIFREVKQRGLKISFGLPNGVSVKTLDREIIEAMKEAGCVEIALAVESGSEYMRNKVIKKGLSNDKIFEVIELCNEFDLMTMVFLVLGMPGENQKTLEENVEFVKKLKGRWFVDYVHPSFATPFPGTALFSQCVEEKLIEKKTIRELMEGNTFIGYAKPVIRLKTLTEKDLINHRNELWKICLIQNIIPLSKRYLKPTAVNLRFAINVFRRFIYSYL